MLRSNWANIFLVGLQEASSTSPGIGNYLYTVNNLLTDPTIVGAEFLTLPRSDGVTLNPIAAVNGTVPVQYTASSTRWTS